MLHALQMVKEAWSDIDVQLKRRSDLIPNLVTAVKAYASHEKETFEQIATLRSLSMGQNADNMTQKSEIEKELGLAIHKLLAVAEAYPDLQASTNFLQLQKALVETEDQIASARRIYNANVTDYNTKISIFPNNMLASFLHFSLLPFFQNE